MSRYDSRGKVWRPLILRGRKVPAGLQVLEQVSVCWIPKNLEDAT